MDYPAFLEQKTHSRIDAGFAPVWMPPFLFDFQSVLVDAERIYAEAVQVASVAARLAENIMTDAPCRMRSGV